MDGWERQNGVMVYDASTDEELMSIGSFLKEKGELGLTAAAPALQQFFRSFLDSLERGVRGFPWIKSFW